MITRAIKNAFEMKKHRKWDKTFWAFDIHNTIIVPNYSRKVIPKEFYPLAKEVLQTISERRDIVRILYTCSHPEEIEQYLDYFKENKIYFDYVNENPAVTNDHGCYYQKLYFNVLFEDKAGFDPLKDWAKVNNVLKEFPE